MTKEAYLTLPAEGARLSAGSQHASTSAAKEASESSHGPPSVAHRVRTGHQSVTEPEQVIEAIRSWNDPRRPIPGSFTFVGLPPSAVMRHGEDRQQAEQDEASSEPPPS